MVYQKDENYQYWSTCKKVQVHRLILVVRLEILSVDQ